MILLISSLTPITVSSAIFATSTSATPRHKISPSSDLKYLAKSGKLNDALRIFESMKPTELDVNTCSILLHACISKKSLLHGQRLHLNLLHSSHERNEYLLRNPILKSKLITLYSVCGRVDEARRVFEYGAQDSQIPESVWVAMAIGYARNGYLREALGVYNDMLHQFVQPGNFAFSIALKACANLCNPRVGRTIHAQIIKSDDECDQRVNNALLTFYADCGCFEDALKVFEVMSERNVVSWNLLIASFASQGEASESLNAFRSMQMEGMGFTWITLTTILPICAQVTALHSGKEIHAQIVKSTKKPDVLVQNSLMDLYAKCGEIDCCRKVFDNIQNKDLISWNTMLSGYARNGQMEEAMDLFDKMVESGLSPDSITFIALLSGCSHAGLAEDGQKLFGEMKSSYGVSPNLEHYACLVDILGRAGKIKEALEVAKNMPMKPSGSIWGSLLNSCRLHASQNIDVVEEAAKRLFELEPENAGNYVMLSNIYANVGMWEAAEKTRELMKRKGMKKEVGCSWLHIRNKIHTFVAGGSRKFRESDEFKNVWAELAEAMEDLGYVPDTGVVLHDLGEEMKASMVCGHSERLATVYALIHTAPGIPIRITKNLRVCADCHTWMKMVSSIRGRLVVLRDTNRFHHFRDGVCSCKDFW